MSQDTLATIINWVFGILALVSTLTFLICTIGTIISAIVEGSRKLTTGQQRMWKATKLFGILSAVSLAVLIVTLILWSLSSFLQITF